MDGHLTYPPTDEQALILEAARKTPDNLIIQALAGAAKTSTLVRLGRALPSTPILCLAFNKRIAVEMKERLSSNCSAKTLNGLGHQIWGHHVGLRNLSLERDKVYNIFSALVEELKGGDKEEAFALFSETLRAINEAKTAGYIPKILGNETRLMNEDELFAWMDEAPTSLQQELIVRASIISAEQAHRGKIDFNDQILLPTVYPVSFEKFSPPLLMVDEAQDLSALNHAMLRKLVRRRIIAVGDSRQAIYGFRGAHGNSMELLRETFSMQEFTLTLTFRCPKSVVEEARWRAPAIRCPETQDEGEVKTLGEWDETSLPHNAAVICRNNAPLFSLALRLMKCGRMPQILGADIGKNLLKILKKFGEGSLPQAEVFDKSEEWRELKLTKSRDPGRIHDQAECLRVFAEQAPTLSGAIAYAEHLFNSEGPIKLMTIHKSKGLEFDHVFILDKGLIRLKQDQEKNLLYVAQTRAKKTLTYVKLEDFQ